MLRRIGEPPQTRYPGPLYCGVLRCIAVYCGVLQRIAAYCGVLRRIAAYCGVLRRIGEPPETPSAPALRRPAMLRRIAANCGILRDIDAHYAGCCSALQRIAGYCVYGGMLRCIAAYCGVLRRIAAYCGGHLRHVMSPTSAADRCATFTGICAHCGPPVDML